MDSIDTELFSTLLGSIPVHLVILLTASLFFFTHSVRELKDGVQQGLLSFALAVFFGGGHATYLFNLPADSVYSFSTITLLEWTVEYLSPAIITLFLLRGLWELIIHLNLNGLIRIFWSMTLVCYLYLLGSSWPLDLKAAIAAFYVVMFLIIETDPSDEPLLSAWRSRI